MSHLKDLPNLPDKPTMLPIKPSYIKILSKYMTGLRQEKDQDIDKLLFLDGLYSEVYEKHKISMGFLPAAKLAYTRVINAVLMGEHENIPINDKKEN